MRWFLGLWLVSLMWLCLGQEAWAQSRGREAVDIFLEDEQLDVEADIPSVDLVLSFRGMQYETIELRRSFLPELFKSVDDAPF